MTRMCVSREGRDDAELGLRRPLADRPMAQRAIETRDAVATTDATTDEALSEAERDHYARIGYRASVRLPLIVRGEVIGLISVFDTSPRTFEGIPLVRGLAQIAAQAMANAGLLDETRRRGEVLRELVELGAVIWRTRDVQSIARVVARRMAATIGAECCEIYRLEQDGGMVCVASWDASAGGFDAVHSGVTVAQFDDYPSTVAALERVQPLVVADRDDPRMSDEERAMFDRWGYNSELCIPMAVEGRVVGMIDIFDTTSRDFRECLDFTLSVGQMVAGAFENATLLERLNATNRELETLVQSGLEFAASLDLEQVLSSVATRMLQVSDSACCDIYRVEGDRLLGLLSVEAEGPTPDFAGTTYDLALLGVAGSVVDSREPVAADDTDDPRVTDFERAEWAKWDFRSSLCLPLLVGGQVVGVVSLFDVRGRRFEHLELLRGLAQVAAQAMANATLYQQLDRSSQRLSLVNDASLELSSTLELRDILLSTAHRLCQIGEAPACDIYLLAGTDLLCVASVLDGAIDESWEGTVSPLDDWASERSAIVGRETVQVSSLDDLRRSRTEAEQLAAFGFESQLIVPLIAKDRVIGIAELLDPRRRHFSVDVVATVEAVCRAAALAIDNANLFEGMQLRRRETELLNAIARRTASSLELDEIATATADELRQLIPFARANLVLTTEDGRFKTIYSSERWLGTPDAYAPDETEIAALETIRRKRVVVWEPGSVPVIGSEQAERSPGEAGASMALLRGDDLIGVLNLAGPDPQVFAVVDRRLLERVATHLSLAINNARLYEEIKGMHLGNLKALSSALNAKDYYTLGHAARVGAYMVLLGHELGWPDDMTHEVEEAAYLHDIGKIGVSDRVLLKPSGLNSREWELMRQHPIFSADIIRPLFPEELVLGVRHHHEHWNGDGYPDGLAGEEIPLVARAMCVVDSYDAMSFRRPYRQAFAYKEALAELERCSGSQFDPQMVDSFKRVLHRLEVQRRQARKVAAEAAARIDAAKHVLLREPADENTPEYREIAAILRDVRDAHPPTRFLTTHTRIDDNKYCIVVDPDEDPSHHSPLGSEVFADEELPEVLAGGVPDVNVLYVDEWGVWVSGLAPVRDACGEIVAVVSADTPPSGVTGADLEGLRSDVAQTFASMLQTTAARLSRAELDAITDGLTGLYNHRYLHERLSEEIDRAREQNRPLSLLFCDLDQFKVFNDLHGHSAGDSALRAVARAIEAGIRKVDLAARYGGEEFAVILIETDADGALEVAERIRADVAALHIEPIKKATLTVSIGVATFPAQATTKEQLLDKADWAMYVAKRQGRDRVVAFAGATQPGEDGMPELLAEGAQLGALADAVDARFERPTARSREAARIAGLIATELELGAAATERVIEAARLADIGQIGVPAELLNKPGELTTDEWRLIREHPMTGERLLRGLADDEQLIQAVVHHHERFDGTGYPTGLSAEEIPLASRIVFAATAYVAMTSARSYAPQRDAETALAELDRCAGAQFDPKIVAALSRALAPREAEPKRG